MKTKILKPTEKNLKICANAIKNGQVVCYKTDTIYGLATNPFLNIGVERIFKAKKRPENKPLILIASNNFLINSIAEINEQTKMLMKNYWPNSVTIIFKLKPNHNLSALVTNFGNTIAIRKPNNEICNKLAKCCGGLITSTSANISGKEVIKKADEVLTEFDEGDIIYCLDGGLTEDITPSTLIDATGEQPVVLRQGKVVVDIKKNWDNFSIFLI